MPHLLWDASALAKRYTQEIGSDTVQALFDGVPRSQIVTTIWGYVETFAILQRRRNGGFISRKAFEKAANALRTEIIESPDTGVLSIDDAAVLEGMDLIQRHSINTSDAAILTVFLRYVRHPEAPPCVLIAADRHLIRTAPLESLPVVNPETFSVSDVPSLLASG